MLKRVIALFALSFMSIFAADKINGAGASFPAPAYFGWAYSYGQESGSEINYQSIGSGGGIKQITSRVVDFGASDEPLANKDLNSAKLLQFPSLIGSIVLAYNINGIKDGELKLRNEVLADIYLGKIKKWNDAKIIKDNPNLKLPNADITVIRRSDGSGTTFNFTSFLAGVSKEWKDGFGIGKAVDWATGIAAKGNEGVTSMIVQTPNSIGYLENAYALKNNLSRAVLTTKSGKWVSPNDDNFKAAAKEAKWSKADNFYQLLVLQDGDNAYPIVAATFILLPIDKPDTNKKIVTFFNWAFNKGDKELTKLGYVPLPTETKNLIREYWRDNKLN
ncbi:MAG: phosphate ABC transporter substrate-binding protein PstS [Campylobacteraceae bacterium]|jgi:phosphate transport system substrate-binding protein|nr:phosphate ABC transporter substrate-binding protein PstS [Campylobacteraceae bacterium]